MSKLTEKVMSAKTRPNATTVKILIAGALLCAVIWFLFISPSSSTLATANEEARTAEGANSLVAAEIVSFRSGESFTARELPAVVGPVETLLPNTDEPGDAAEQLRVLAVAAGLTAPEIEYPSGFTAAGEGKKQAKMTMSVAGTTTQIVAWFNSLSVFEQLTSVATSNVTVDQATGEATMIASIDIWASDLEEWADGLDQQSPPAGTETTEEES